MTTELTSLFVFVILLLLLILAQVATAFFQVGLAPLVGNRENLILSGMPSRLERALNNSVIALALITPAVLAIQLLQASTPLSASLMLMFVVARLAHAICYGLGIAWFRTAAWLVGFGCTLLLYLKLLEAM